MGLVDNGIPEKITLELAKVADTNYFIEAGTYTGGTSLWASEKFKKVYTIEASKEQFEISKKNLSSVKNVSCYFGDSTSVLPEILNELGNSNGLFWLDSHWSGGATAGADKQCPLLDELQLLAGRDCGDIILVDDARLFLSAPPTPQDPEQWPNIYEICEAIRSSSEKHYMQIINDVIYIVPNETKFKAILTDYSRSSAKFSGGRLGNIKHIRNRLLTGLR